MLTYRQKREIRTQVRAGGTCNRHSDLEYFRHAKRELRRRLEVLRVTDSHVFSRAARARILNAARS